MGLFYIQDVIDNYYNISLEERLKLIQMLKQLHATHTYDIGISYHDILDTIELLTKKAYQAEQLEKTYGALTQKQQKELRTQTHIKAKEYKGQWWYDVPKSYELASEILTLDKPEKIEVKEPTFKIDFARLEEELGGKDTDYYGCEFNVGAFFRTFTGRHFYFALGIIDHLQLTDENKKDLYQKYTKPMLNEFYLAEQRYNDVIRSEFSDSTEKLFSSLEGKAQLYTIFDMLDIDIEKLNWQIECREYKNNKRKDYQELVEEAKEEKKEKRKKHHYKNNSRRCYSRR